MVSVENLAGLVLLVAMGSLGVAVLRRAGLGLEPLEQAAYGFPLGVVAASLVLLPPAIVVGFGGALVAVVGVAAAAGAAAGMDTSATGAGVGGGGPGAGVIGVITSGCVRVSVVGLLV